MIKRSFGRNTFVDNLGDAACGALPIHGTGAGKAAEGARADTMGIVLIAGGVVAVLAGYTGAGAAAALIGIGTMYYPKNAGASVKDGGKEEDMSHLFTLPNETEKFTTDADGVSTFNNTQWYNKEASETVIIATGAKITSPDGGDTWVTATDVAIGKQEKGAWERIFHVRQAVGDKPATMNVYANGSWDKWVPVDPKFKGPFQAYVTRLDDTRIEAAIIDIEGETVSVVTVTL